MHVGTVCWSLKHVLELFKLMTVFSFCDLPDFTQSPITIFCCRSAICKHILGVAVDKNIILGSKFSVSHNVLWSINIHVELIIKLMNLIKHHVDFNKFNKFVIITAHDWHLCR